MRARRWLAPCAAVAVVAAPTTSLADDDEPPVVVPARGKARRGERPGPRRARSAVEFEETRRPYSMGPEGFPLAGYHGGHFFLRDDHDQFRLYPGLLMQVDTRATFGRGVRDVDGPAGDPLHTQMTMRRARVDLGGEILSRWSFFLSGDLAGPKPHLEHGFLEVRVARWLRLSVGQQQVPFTMENRTNEAHMMWLERPLAVRFGQPSNKDLGVMAAGRTRGGVFAYEVGAFGGDANQERGPVRQNADERLDGVARVVARPLATTGTIARNIQIGASVRYGMRAKEDVRYPLAPILTDGGYTLFATSYRGADGRTVNILPSGLDTAFAGEVRVPVSRLDFRFEFVSLRRNTREAVAGLEATHSERFGHMSGSAFYAQLGVFLMGRPGLREAPGRFSTPHIGFPKGHPEKAPRGLEIVLRGESLRAKYSPGDRAAVPGDASPDARVAVDVVGAGVNYYATHHASLSLGYGYVMVPGSYIGDNAALAPGNLGCRTARTDVGPNTACHTGAHSLHELTLRGQIAF